MNWVSLKDPAVTYGLRKTQHDPLKPFNTLRRIAGGGRAGDGTFLLSIFFHTEGREGYNSNMASYRNW